MSTQNTGRTCRSCVEPQPGIRFSCSRTQGHKGRHAARGINGVTVRRWTR